MESVSNAKRPLVALIDYVRGKPRPSTSALYLQPINQFGEYPVSATGYLSVRPFASPRISQRDSINFSMSAQGLNENPTTFLSRNSFVLFEFANWLPKKNYIIWFELNLSWCEPTWGLSRRLRSFWFFNFSLYWTSDVNFDLRLIFLFLYLFIFFRLPKLLNS